MRLSLLGPSLGSTLRPICRCQGHLARREIQNILGLYPHVPLGQLRCGSSSSSTRWKARQSNDGFSQRAKVEGLKSRAAFKLLEINERYKLFKPGQTVVDLGYAPGSWSQVAIDRTQPAGRVVGIDIIPAQPPKGVSTLQGNFLSPSVQASLKQFLRESPSLGRSKQERSLSTDDEAEQMTQGELEERNVSYLELERRTTSEHDLEEEEDARQTHGEIGHKQKKSKKDSKTSRSQRAIDEAAGRTVDVVLSDMWEPWAQTEGFWKRSLNNPYRRMMNTSGNAFRDHAGSMDLCDAALLFAFDMLRDGGSLVCKFYQGGEDKAFEKRLKALFKKVHREKPESSRSESREGFFVALKRRGEVEKDSVWPPESNM